MILWVLIWAVAAGVNGPYVAFSTQEACEEANATTVVKAECVPFAADKIDKPDDDG